MFQSKLAAGIIGRQRKLLTIVKSITTDGSFAGISVPIIKCPIAKHLPLFPHFERTQEITDAALIDMLTKQLQWNRPFAGVFMHNELPNTTQCLWRTGTLAQFQVLSHTPEQMHIHLTGLDRIKLIERPPSDGWLLTAHIDKCILNDFEKGNLYDALTMMIVADIKSITEIDSRAADIFLAGILKNREHFQSVEFLCDLATLIAQASTEQMRTMLEEMDIVRRMKLALELLRIRRERVQLQVKLVQDAEKNIAKLQERILLTEQLNVLRVEMGVQSNKDVMIQKCKNAIDASMIPNDISVIVHDEIKVLQGLNVTQPEFNITCNYLQWLINMPWTKTSIDNLNLENARNVLDVNHHGMDTVKARILEFVAVANLRGSPKGKILCLHGASGTGKTTIARSIAKVLNRQFQRISVGGMNNAVELRGHRRTYLAAMPGKIVQSLKTANTLNPVILIDEIDKIYGNRYGANENPASVLLELLDPEQNAKFHDHYLDVPVDLSNVLFICTANNLFGISEPLIDRMELIQLNGYSDAEKIVIAKQYLIPNILTDCGLAPAILHFDDNAIELLVQQYCRDAGVRNLRNHLEKVVRKIALRMCKGEAPIDRITKTNLITFLGQPREKITNHSKYLQPGMVTGMAFTANGGDILLVETAPADKLPSTTNAHMKLTGQLGATLCNSAHMALTYARNFMQHIDPKNLLLERHEIHVHIPDLSVPKDGPSAGVTITSALLSLALNRSVPANVAMTGEISLRGKILPVGGIREKILAAQRNGITWIILPYHNRHDFEGLSNEITKHLQVNFVEDYREVFRILFPELV